MSSPLHAQILVTGSAQQLSSTQGAFGATVIKAPATNKNPIYIGNSGVTVNNGHQLDPGDEMQYEYKGANLGSPWFDVTLFEMYVVGTPAVGDKLTWFASP